jgi:hypothetical protein
MVAEIGDKDRTDSSAGAPADEMEITPEMIAAGLRAFGEWDSRIEEPAGLVIEVYRAMREAREAAA